MTTGEMLYLIGVIGAFGAFGVALFLNYLHWTRHSGE